MRTGHRVARATAGGFWGLVLAAVGLLVFGSPAEGAARLVVVLYPDDNDGRPGNLQTNRGIRSTFAAGSSDCLEVHNEYLDLSRLREAEYQRHLAEFLRWKYQDRKVDLVIAGLSPALDFALKHRDQVFPGAPLIYCAIEQREVKARALPPDVIGVPIQFDLQATLDLALRLHPDTRRVVVVSGKAKFDAFWEAEARRLFQPYASRLEFVYLSGMPMDDLLREVARLPERTVIYYLHVFQDGNGKMFAPADALELLTASANAPVYGHVDTYVGRGAVGGRVFRFELAGREAAELGLRVLAGERPETIQHPEASATTDLFDWRQLSRWGIAEGNLPAGSVVQFRDPTFWDLYKWHLIGIVSLCVVETLLIAGLLLQRARRRQALDRLRESQHELQVLTSRLLQVQEAERRAIARELHDDLNQGLALIAIELDMLGQKPLGPGDQMGGRFRDLAVRVKKLSSSVHDLSHQLHPSKLEQLGLLAAVRGLCKELSDGHGMPIDFTGCDLPVAVPEDTALCLYRITQEALQNVVKHSGAQHARVELRSDAGAISLSIVDDGVGFDLSQVSGRGSLGLISMRERLRLVGGEIALDSRPSKGTRIAVRVPVTGADGAEHL